MRAIVGDETWLWDIIYRIAVAHIVAFAHDHAARVERSAWQLEQQPLQRLALKARSFKSAMVRHNLDLELDESGALDGDGVGMGEVAAVAYIVIA